MLKSKTSCLFLLFLISFIKINAQSSPPKNLYLIATFGLARSEDGLAFLAKQSTSQWTPMVNIGLGYRFGKHFGVEILSSSMITSLKAEGTLISNTQNAKVTTRHSSIVLSPVFYLPFTTKSEVFVRTGAGLLLSTTKINSSANPNFSKSSSNLGYMVAIGYAYKVNPKLTITGQFDFSDAYGKNDVWTGDLGQLNFGIRYSLTNAK
jgi:opacity protein-like surface antigen